MFPPPQGRAASKGGKHVWVFTVLDGFELAYERGCPNACRPEVGLSLMRDNQLLLLFNSVFGFPSEHFPPHFTLEHGEPYKTIGLGRAAGVHGQGGIGAVPECIKCGERHLGNCGHRNAPGFGYKDGPIGVDTWGGDSAFAQLIAQIVNTAQSVPFLVGTAMAWENACAICTLDTLTGSRRTHLAAARRAEAIQAEARAIKNHMGYLDADMVRLEDILEQFVKVRELEALPTIIMWGIPLHCQILTTLLGQGRLSPLRS